MRIWTITRAETLEVLLSVGNLQCQKELADPDFLSAYYWMALQMRVRIGLPPDKAELPLWGWAAYAGTDRPRPDLRRSGHLPRGTRGVMLELEMQEPRVLLSCFQAWHNVLNRTYLPISEADCDQFDHEAAASRVESSPFDELPPEWQLRVESSWLRIFDIESNAVYWGARATRPVQACFWEVNRSDILHVTRFVSR